MVSICSAAAETPPAATPSIRSDAVPWRGQPFAYRVILLTLAAAVLRISFIDSKSLWLDEAFTAHRVMLPLSELLKVIIHGRMNMSLYYLVVAGWASVAGSSEFMLRLPSVLFGTATVPLVYVLGAELWGRRTGLIAATLVTVNATSIQYAQTARSYTMLVMFATLASIFFIRAIKRNAAPRGLAGYLVSETFTVYAHLFGIFALPAQWISLFIFRPNRKVAIRLTACIITIGILSLPAFFFSISSPHWDLEWIPPTSIDSLRDLLFSYAGAFDGRATSLTVILTGLYLVGVSLAVYSAQTCDWPALGYLLLAILVPIAFTFAVSMFKPLFVSRYLLTGLPLFGLLAAVGFQRLKPALAIVMAVCALSLAEDYFYYRAPSIQDWRGVVEFVAVHSQPGDMLIVYDTATPIEYYVAQYSRRKEFPMQVYEGGVTRSRRTVKTPEAYLAAAGGGAHHRLWFTFLAGEPWEEQLLFLSRLRSRVIEQPAFDGVRLYLLEKGP
jgi:mannosyltransferase